MTTLAKIRIKIKNLDLKADEQKQEVAQVKKEFEEVTKTLTKPLQKEKYHGNS